MRAGVFGWIALLAVGAAVTARSQCLPPRGAASPPPIDMAYLPKRLPTPAYQGTFGHVKDTVGKLFASVQIASGPFDGVVDSQFPAPRTEVIPGTQTLWLCMKSANPSLVQTIFNGLITGLASNPNPAGNLGVPNLKNDSHQDAINALKGVHMKPKFADPQGDDTWGVIGQTIPATTPEPQGTEVGVTMGPPVPDLRNHTVSDATQMLMSSGGLSIGYTHGGTKGAGDQLVLSQNPLPPMFVQPGSEVDIWLPTETVPSPPVEPRNPLGNTVPTPPVPPTSPGDAVTTIHTRPRTTGAGTQTTLETEVPNVVGMSEPMAADAIHDRGLTEGVIDGDGTGAVISQAPLPQEQVDVGTLVFVRHKSELPPLLVWLLGFAGLGLGTTGGLISYRLARHAKIRAMTSELKPYADKGSPAVTIQLKVQLELRGRPAIGTVTVQRNATVEKVERGALP